MGGFVDYVKKLRGSNSPQFLFYQKQEKLLEILKNSKADVYSLEQEKTRLMSSENMDLLL